jgi:hypothetical protein
LNGAGLFKVAGEGEQDVELDSTQEHRRARALGRPASAARQSDGSEGDGEEPNWRTHRGEASSHPERSGELADLRRGVGAAVLR